VQAAPPVAASSWEPADADASAMRQQPARREGVPLLRVVNVEANDVLWVRQGPGTEHEEIGSLQPNGRGIELVGPCTGDWCRIAYRGLRGWASRHYLMADGLATTTR
jgi:SH3-like domain-containing protein